jgi:Glycine zipper 2TM domain
MNRKSASVKSASVLIAAAVLAGCATVPATSAGPHPVTQPEPVVPAESQVGPQPVSAPAPEPVNLTRVYFYPQKGQSEAQQDRDRFECYNWSVRQTGFDPGRRALPPEQHVTVEPARSQGETVAGGAVTGAVVGAAVSSPWHTGRGALLGAIAGTVIGAATADSQAAEAKRREESINRRANSRVDGRYQQQAAEYRRAMSACLEGRGYIVK